MAVDDVFRPERVEPALHGLALHTHGGQVDHHLEVGVVHRVEQALDLVEAVADACLLRAQGFARDGHAVFLGHLGQAAVHLGRALEALLLGLVPVAPAAVGLENLRAELRAEADAVGKIAEAPFDMLGLLRGELVAVAAVLRREHRAGEAALLKLAADGRGVLIAVLVHPEPLVRRQQLDVFDAELRLAVEEIVERIIIVMDIQYRDPVDVDQLHLYAPLMQRTAQTPRSCAGRPRAGPRNSGRR